MSSSSRNTSNGHNITPTLIVADATKGVKVNAETLAKPFREEVQKRVLELKTDGRNAPLLVGILANSDPAAKQYAEWTGKACQNDGLRYELRTVDDPLDVDSALQQANDDPTVHGIIVYYPIFGQQETFSGSSQDDYIRDSVSYKRDVEGLCHLYRTNLYRNVRFLDYPRNSQKCLVPCTALAVVKILEQCPGVYYSSSKPCVQSSERQSLLKGKVVTIINRSEIVGRPLAAMLANDGATVYSIDINSIYELCNGKLRSCSDETPESCVRKSSVVVSGVPSKSYRLPTDWIQPNTTVINVASYKNVDEASLMQIPGVVYVPQVGKVTVAMLERNLIRLYDQFHHNEDANVQFIQEQERRISGARENSVGFMQHSTVQQPPQPPMKSKPWYDHPLNLYTAGIVTLLLAMQLTKLR